MTSETQPMSLSSSQEQLTDHENMHVEHEPDTETTVNTSTSSDSHKDVSVHYDTSTSASNGTTYDNIKATDSKTFSHAPGGQDSLLDPECQSLSTQGEASGNSSGMSYLQENGVQETAECITEPVLSVRMLMSSRDVGSIIGKGGMTIKAFRETDVGHLLTETYVGPVMDGLLPSGARINISNSTSSERLVQITGSRESVAKAFAAIGKKIEIDTIVARHAEAQLAAVGPPESITDGEERDSNSLPTVSFRLVIQTSQCGSLIGKGGSKIKEIRESTGASIQVAGETLPNSTERSVTVSGTPLSLTLCIAQICNIMLENPPRGPHIPYKPHALPNQAYQPRPNLPFQTPYTATFHTTAGPATTSQTMRIPNDLIGCVIGRKGSKIHEIRVSSGAQIKIAGNEGDSHDRLVTITGTPEAVGLAQYLINSRIHSEVNTFISVGLNL